MSAPPPATEELAPRGNGPAVASLACGLMVFVPVVTSVLAIAFAYAGFRRTRRPGVGGRGLATAGMVLGFLGLVGWGVAGPPLVRAVLDLYASRAVAEHFLRAVSTGDLDAASALAVPALDRDGLALEHDLLAPLGRLRSVRFTDAERDSEGPERFWIISGDADFDEGPRRFRITVVRERGALRVRSLIAVGQF